MTRRRSLDLVDGAGLVSEPCELSWDDLVGGDKERGCERCRKTVIDLSAMTRTEASIRLHNSVGPPCIRYELGPSGEVAFLPEFEATDVSNAPRGAPLFSPRAFAFAMTITAVPVAACSKESTPSAFVATEPCGVLETPTVEGKATKPRSHAVMGKMVDPGGTGPHGRGQSQLKLKNAGYLSVQSHVPVSVTVAGVELIAPFVEYALPPGTHTLKIGPKGPDTKTRFVTIVADEIVTEALD